MGCFSTDTFQQIVGKIPSLRIPIAFAAVMSIRILNVGDSSWLLLLFGTETYMIITLLLARELSKYILAVVGKVTIIKLLRYETSYFFK